MSALLIGLGRDLTEALLEELRPETAVVVVPDAPDAAPWRGSATVVVGDFGDRETAHRACLGVEVVVAGDYFPMHRELREGLTDVLEGTEVSRVVVVGAGEPDELVGAVEAEKSMDYVILRFRRRGWIRHKALVGPGRLATAIVAAMKLDGPVRLDLDLTDGSSWSGLGLAGDGG